MSGRQLADLFDEFTHDAWRLEARDDYDVPVYRPALEAWRAGQPAPARDDGWLDTVRAVRGRGARIGRVRLVGHPLTDYTRWEFTQYAENVEHGEDVRLLDRSDMDNPPAVDVWLFDNLIAFVQHYSDAGEYLGAEEVDPGPYVALRRCLDQLAVPFADYQIGAH